MISWGNTFLNSLALKGGSQIPTHLALKSSQSETEREFQRPEGLHEYFLLLLFQCGIWSLLCQLSCSVFKKLWMRGKQPQASHTLSARIQCPFLFLDIHNSDSSSIHPQWFPLFEHLYFILNLQMNLVFIWCSLGSREYMLLTSFN